MLNVCDSLLRPGHAIRGTVSGKCVSAAHEFDPIRRDQAGVAVLPLLPPVLERVLPGHAVARSHRDDRRWPRWHS